MVNDLGSVALLSHFDKVLALSKFALLKCENEVNPTARIPWATSTTQIEIAGCWWPRESMLWGSLQFRTLKVQILKVLTNCQSAKVKQLYLCPNYGSHFFRILIFREKRKILGHFSRKTKKKQKKKSYLAIWPF